MAIERRRFLFSLAGLACSAAPAALRAQVTGATAPETNSPVVVHYIPDDSGTAILVSRGERQLHFSIQLTDVAGLAARHIALITQASTGKEHDELLQLCGRLYDCLWEPFESVVPAGATVFIRADGPLHGLPFESLHTGSIFLGQRMKLRYLAVRPDGRAAAGPVLSVATGRGLVYAPIGKGRADSGLDTAMAEARRIPYLLTNVKWATRLGSNATKLQYYRDTARPFAVLHIATHGVSDPATGLTSLALRPEAPAAERGDVDLLSSAEIRRTQLSGRLVVLAACNSGIAQGQESNAMESLGEAFLAAGVSEAIATRWKIDDLATSEFMRTFYRSLGRGHGTASALRAARASLIVGPYLPFRNPHFWAPFMSLSSTVFPD